MTVRAFDKSIRARASAFWFRDMEPRLFGRVSRMSRNASLCTTGSARRDTRAPGVGGQKAAAEAAAAARAKRRMVSGVAGFESG